MNDSQIDLFITVDFPPHSGGEAAYHNLLTAQYPSPCEVLTVKAPHAEVSDANTARNISRIPHIKLFLPILFFLHVLFFISKKRIRFIHGGQLRTVGFACLLLKITNNIPYGIHVYGGELSKYAEHPLWRFLLSPVLKNAHALFANSEWTKKQFINYGVSADKIHVIHPGVDTDKFYPMKNRSSLRKKLDVKNKQVLLSIGRLDPHKGTDKVLQALPQLIERNPDILFVIGGTGKMRPSLEQSVKKLGLDNNVRFLGYVPDKQLPEWYNVADTFIMPSRIGTGTERGVEGFGIVYLEANACGCPVIGGNSGGVKDAIKDGVNGLLVDPQNPKDIARAIRKVLSNESLRNKLSQQAKERTLRRFTAKISAETLSRHITHLTDTIS